MKQFTAPAKPETLTCDLCIIGAGAAGLNALFVAAQYLKPDARVVLIDRRDEPGGMWTDVYDFCRLHQPHPAFTVGNMDWSLSRPTHYLATGTEVATHLRQCLAKIEASVNLEVLFGHNVVRCEEGEAERGAMARIECEPVDGTEDLRIIEAKQVVKAIGFDVPTPEPLPLSSPSVVSTTPRNLAWESSDAAPVFIVGGGKTGMDTAHAMITRSPGRAVSLINGKGTVFVRRETFFPSGSRRWWDGQMIATFFRDMALRFDGSNEDEIFAHMSRNFTVTVPGSAENFFFGILSEEERDTIANGLNDIHNDYLTDVVDGQGGPEMVMRSGKRHAVPAGSVFVNCTGHLVRHSHAYEPYLSKSGAVLSITPRSLPHFLSTMSAYFLSHLFFSGKLAETPLYELDCEEIMKKGNRIYHTALMSLSFLNMLIMLRALPFKVFDQCGLDIDRLYPLHRRAVALLDLKLNSKRYIAHCRAALDRVRDRTGVRCGPLDYGTSPAETSNEMISNHELLRYMAAAE